MKTIRFKKNSLCHSKFIPC